MKIIIFLIISFAITININAASNADSLNQSGMITVVPGPEYEAGWLHKIFFGPQWRTLWSTPITVPVLDLHNNAGGLTPIKRGGGFQTKSLHFKGNDGKFYKFRSINKDPKKVMPQVFRDTFVGDIVQDMISTSHPLSAIITAPLLNAVDVLNAQPSVVNLPDDQKLGEYHEDFYGVLGTFAENPKDEIEDTLIFAGADKIIKLYKIFEKLEEDNDNQVDALEFLKARLMDVLLGDWDRHAGQFKWARYKQDGKNIWKPIPRDRDQAFALYDGFIPWIATLAIPQIEGFEDEYKQINDLTWAGRYLDRRFLVSIDKPAWDSVTTFIQTRLTDTVIGDAVRRMPEEWFAKDGDRLIYMLKERRNKLHEVSEEYYEMISNYVSIYASDKREYAEINRLDNDRVLVSIYKKDKKTGKKKGEPFFNRTFYYDTTNEIRIELLGGDDTAVITGEVDRSITVLVIGGKGKDKLTDKSIVRGNFLSVTPFRSAETKSIFYDSGEKTEFTSGPSSKLITDKFPKPKPFDPEKDRFHGKYEPLQEDRDYDWKRGFWLGYNSRDGFTIGGGPILYKFGYRVAPHVYRMSLLLAYMTNIETFALDYKGEFYTLIKNIKTTINLRKITGHTFFHGYGNETILDEVLENENYYRVRPDLFEFNLSFDFKLTNNSSFWVGTSYDNSVIKYDPGSILDSLQLQNTEERNQIGFHLGYTLDTRDHESTPRNGVFIDFKSLNYPAILDRDKKYNKITLDSRAYLSTDFITPSSFAVRLAGEKVWGNYPLHMTPFLGGSENLHGFERQRFAGDGLLFGAVGIRSYLLPVRIIVPARFGISAFAETGRVFNTGENSNKWHPTVGGGAWLIYLDRQLTLNFALAKSSESTIMYFSTGFMF